jgi:hypothetical protein
MVVIEQSGNLGMKYIQIFPGTYLTLFSIERAKEVLVLHSEGRGFPAPHIFSLCQEQGTKSHGFWQVIKFKLCGTMLVLQDSCEIGSSHSRLTNASSDDLRWQTRTRP